MSEPILSVKCNCLYPDTSVRTDGVLGAAAAPVVKSAVKRQGNWVGGAVKCFEDRLVFSMNAVNAKFQKDSTDVSVAYADIKGIQLGKMMWLFKTVDLDTVYGPMRFRCAGKSNDRLLAAIEERLA